MTHRHPEIALLEVRLLLAERRRRADLDRLARLARTVGRDVATRGERQRRSPVMRWATNAAVMAGAIVTILGVGPLPRQPFADADPTRTTADDLRAEGDDATHLPSH